MKLLFIFAITLSLMFPGPVVEPSVLCAASAGSLAAAPFEACPEVPVNISHLAITPISPASQHTVQIVWSDAPPSCFPSGTFIIQGTVTFGTHQIRTFSRTVENPEGGHNTIEIQVPGLTGQLPPPNPSPQLAPFKVAVRIDVRQDASVSGDSASVTLPGSSLCPAQVNVQVTNATMIGLSPIPNRPGDDFHPKVRVNWQVSNPFSCFVLNKAVVSVTLRAGGKTHRAQETRLGTGLSPMTLLVDSVAVGENFQPDEVQAVVTVAGAARLHGVATKEIHLH